MLRVLPSAHRRREALAGAGLLLTLLLAIGETVASGAPSLLAAVPYLATLPLLLPALGRQHRLFLAGCVACTAILVTQGKAGDVVRALGQSVALAALMVALVWLRLAAERSTALALVSRAVAERPRSVRHLALALASHFIGVLLNVGVFGLMAPLVAEARAAPADERDMALAVLRGFGFTMLWAPTAAAQVVITTVVPAVTWDAIAPRAATMALSMIALSWLYAAWAHRRLPRPEIRPAPLDARPMAALALLIAVMVGIILALHVAGGYRLTGAVTLASLVVATLWLVVQARRRREPAGPVLGALARRYRRTDLARAAPEVVTLGAAGFLGIAVAAMIPEPWLEAAVAPFADHTLLLYLVVTLFVPAVSSVGLNPLVAASLIGGSFAAIPAGHVEPATLAFALAAGWGVAYGISPFTTGAVVLGAALRVRPETLCWRWNGAFTLVVLAYACAAVAAVALLD